MVSGMKTEYPRELNKGLGSKFHQATCPIGVRKEVSEVRQEIPEEGWKAHRPKRCTDNNEDEDNSPNNTNNTNSQLN